MILSSCHSTLTPEFAGVLAEMADALSSRTAWVPLGINIRPARDAHCKGQAHPRDDGMMEQQGKEVRRAAGGCENENRHTCTCVSQERQFWEWPYQDYHGDVKRFFAAHVRCPADVDDLVQDVFARLIRRRHIPQRPGIYIRIVAQNQLRSYWRRKKKVIGGTNGADGVRAGTVLSDPQADPLEQLSVQETRLMIEQAMGRLPEMSARAVQLRIVQGLPLDEIARELCCSRDALRKRLQRARQSLRELCGQPKHDEK